MEFRIISENKIVSSQPTLMAAIMKARELLYKNDNIEYYSIRIFKENVIDEELIKIN